MKKIVFLITVLFSITTIAQQSYDVILLPKKFDFLSEDNMHNLNALTKSFFETEGFTVYYKEDIIPKEIANNRCASLFADVVESNTLFVTKVEVVLKDCQNAIVFTSAIGSSKDKESAKAYNEALRSALTSLRGNLKFKNVNTNTIEVEKETVEEIVEKKEEILAEKNTNPNQLFAIPTNTGYKLVDRKLNVIIELRATTTPSVFIANKEDIIGVFIEKGYNWYFEYYLNNRLVSEKTDVKF